MKIFSSVISMSSSFSFSIQVAKDLLSSASAKSSAFSVVGSKPNFSEAIFTISDPVQLVFYQNIQEPFFHNQER